MITPTPAHYRSAKFAKYAGNPFIEALPPPLSLKTLRAAITVLPERPVALASYTPLERKMLTEDIAYAYLMPPQLIKLYEEIYIALHEGYVARNPFCSDFQQALYRNVDPYSAPLPGGKTTATSLLYVAPTGYGKSCAVRRGFAQLPTVIEHTEYHNQSFRQKQIVYLKIDCPSNGSRLAFISNLWHAFDRALGTNYFEQYAKTREKTPTLQRRISIACAVHAVGFLIVDELHYLRSVLEDNDKDRATLPFIDELLNGIGVPVLLVGTWKSSRLLTKTAETTRRICSGFTLMEVPYSPTDGYWQKLVATLWDYQYCLKPQVLTTERLALIHQLTGGLPALLTKLLIGAQKYAIDTQREAVDDAVLLQTFKTEFIPLHDALAALRKGDFDRYEDLLPREERTW